MLSVIVDQEYLSVSCLNQLNEEFSTVVRLNVDWLIGTGRTGVIGYVKTIFRSIAKVHCTAVTMESRVHKNAFTTFFHDFIVE